MAIGCVLKHLVDRSLQEGSCREHSRRDIRAMSDVKSRDLPTLMLDRLRTFGEMLCRPKVMRRKIGTHAEGCGMGFTLSGCGPGNSTKDFRAFVGIHIGTLPSRADVHNSNLGSISSQIRSDPSPPAKPEPHQGTAAALFAPFL